MKQKLGLKNSAITVSVKHFESVPQFHALLQQHDLNSFEKIFFTSIEDSRRDVPYRLPVRLNLGPICFLKRHWGRGAHKQAQAEWKNIKRLQQANVNVPRLVALGTGRINNMPTAFIITKKVPGLEADQYLVKNTFKKKQFILDFAKHAANFHNQGYTHRDFYLGHHFVEKADAGYRFYLIDLQRVQRRRFCNQRWVIKDLAQLYFTTPNKISHADKLRFYLQYKNKASLDRKDKHIIRKILKKFRQIKAREHKF